MKTPQKHLLMNTSTVITDKAVICWLFLAIAIVQGCGKKSADRGSTRNVSPNVSPQYEVVSNDNWERKPVPDSVFYSSSDTGTVMDKPQLMVFYKADWIKEYYGKRVLPPKFDYNVDLSKKTYLELRILRNTVFARNGFLFTDPTLRTYFNQFPWYQPIFGDTTFKVYLDENEKAFVDKVTKLEDAKLADAYDFINGNKMIKMDHVVNLTQYQNINDSLTQALTENNFALAAANNDQLFYVYDKNQYGFIPNFITTDLYLQVLHKYLSSIMEDAEKQKLIPTVTDLLERLYNKSWTSLKGLNDVQEKSAAAWANTYLAIGLSVLGETPIKVDPSMKSLFDEEFQKVENAEGYGSRFLNHIVFYYSQFEPRGNYTKDDTLKTYFRCMKWLNSAPMNIDDDNSFNASLMIAYWIETDQKSKQDFDILNKAIGLLAGDEDNNSISQLIRLIDDDEIKSLDELCDTRNIEKLRSQMKATGINRIQPKAGNDTAKEDLAKRFILFNASRYTFDSEILSRLVHVKRPNPLRPFPKGLDVFATLGNKTAENILLNEYKETQKWGAYGDSLNLLKSEFGHLDNWNLTIYNKTMECLNWLASKVPDNYPVFMQTDSWQRKNLNTCLASWTELKHDMILYTEQAFAAEAGGDNEGPPPPVQMSYVEPNITFWNKVIELLDLQEKYLSDLGIMTDGSKSITAELRGLAQSLLDVSIRELNNQQITNEEFDNLSWIGGKIEQLTFDILKTDHLPEREKQISLVADVYALNDTVLEEAVGNADEIYVIAPINGIPCLTKGACFSYYEFTSKTRLTDEGWKQQIARGKIPERPEWLNSIYVSTPSLKARPGYTFNDYVSHGERPGYEP